MKKFVFEDTLNPLLNGRRVIIYGAGVNGLRLLARLAHLRSEKPDVLGFVDADKAKQGKTLLGFPVFSPEQLKEYDRQSTSIIVSPDRHFIEIRESLNRIGFHDLFYLGWNAQVIHEIEEHEHMLTASGGGYATLFSNGADKISYVREILHDQKSLDVFNAKISSRLKGSHVPLANLCEGNQYFPGDIVTLHDSEVFVDGGAYDGGTFLDFINKAGNYRYIYSFEPDPPQYELTKAVVASKMVKNCEVHNLGLFDREGELMFSSRDQGDSRFDKGGDIKVGATSLDAFLYDKAEHPTFIKMDIEGAEQKALRGAEKIIGRNYPKLAISAYHAFTDLWEIPYWIKTNFPDYKIYFRQHAPINETVCYAVL